MVAERILANVWNKEIPQYADYKFRFRGRAVVHSANQNRWRDTFIVFVVDGTMATIKFIARPHNFFM